MTWAPHPPPPPQSSIAAAYNTIGEELGAIVSPVGLVWQDFLAEHERPVLYDRDQSHPTLAGSYLAACVFLAVLLKANPVGIDSTPTGLNDQDQAALQRAAWKRR
jgi:hypothetical protein